MVFGRGLNGGVDSSAGKTEDKKSDTECRVDGPEREQ